MSAIHTSLKTLACSVGALAITAVMSWSFVQSTATVTHGGGVAPPTAHMSKLSIQQRHAWFGQFEPAVLVD